MHQSPNNGIVLHGMQCVMVHVLIAILCSQVEIFEVHLRTNNVL